MLNLEPIIKYAERYYKSVSALDTDFSTGIIPANGEKIAIYNFRANGSEPTCYVALVWDYNGDEETFIASTKGDIDISFDCCESINQFTGDGSKKMQIMISNENITASPIIGGAFECIEVS